MTNRELLYPPKWDRSLGTSKKDQGVWTPPAPHHAKRRREFFARLHAGKLVKILWYKIIWRKLLTFWKK